MVYITHYQYFVTIGTGFELAISADIEKAENGHVAQWLEHLSDEEAVDSSILSMPTIGIP